MPQNKYFGDIGLDSLAVGGNNPIFSFLTSAMASGKVLADDGKAYDSVQTAQDAASSFMLVGPGTFSENVTIDTTNLTVVGAGYDTLIDGDTSDAIILDASGITLRDLSAKTTAGGGNTNTVISTTSNADSCTLDTVFVPEADDRGFRIEHGSDHIVNSCNLENVEGKGIECGTVNRMIISNSHISEGLKSDNNGGDIIVANCVIDGGFDNLKFNSDDSIVIGCRMLSPDSSSIEVNGADCISANNRIDGSIGGGGTNHVIDGNLTGSAN